MRARTAKRQAIQLRLEVLEDRMTPATVDAASVVAPVSTTFLGANLTWWDNQLTTSQTQQMVNAAGLAAFRFPGGGASDDFHFNVADNFGDPVAITIPQFAQFIETAGGPGVVTLDYGSGSPQEAAAELAYLEGSPTDTTAIGNGLEWNDSANAWQNVDWKTVGYWASLRAAQPLATDDGYNFLRIDHPDPFANITYWEVGNEEYGSWEVDHHGTAGPGGVSTGAQHDPATYVAFAQTFANYAAEIDPNLSIGIDSGDPTGANDNNWTDNVLKAGLAQGFVPGFISDHNYVQSPGDESDSFLLQNTVTDPISVFDWTTRYNDYESVLKADLGNQAGNVSVMGTEFNSVNTDPGKQTTSLVNGLFIADSIGSLLSSGYSGGFVWALRNGWLSGNNNSPSLYGWRQGGDFGLLGDPDPNSNDPPSTGPYVPYPSYFAEQLASKLVQAGGSVVSANSDSSTLDVFAVSEANGHLVLLVINKDPNAPITEPFTIQGFTPSSNAQLWQYSEDQDNTQSQSATGDAALVNNAVTLNLNDSNFSYSFPAYSMTVLDLSPSTSSPPAPPGAATQLMVTTAPPSTGVAGQAFGLVVSVEDKNGNVDSTFDGPVTVALQANPSNGKLGGTLTVNASNGVATFSGLTLDQAGNGYDLQATAISSTGSALSIATSSFNIGAGAASQLLITSAPPSTVVAGQGFGLVVSEEDRFGNIETTFNGSVSVALKNGGGSTTLGGTLTVNADNGMATYSGLMLDRAGSGYALQLSGAGLNQTTSAFTVAAAAATQLVVTTQPSPSTVSPGQGFGLVVSAEDPFGNVDPNFTGAVTVALQNNPGGAGLKGNLNINAVNGQATFTDLTLNDPGTGYTLQVTANGLTAMTTAPVTVFVPTPPPLPPHSPPPASKPAPPPAAAANVPSLLAFFNEILGAVETVNANGTTITDGLFGFPLVETFDRSGNLVSVTILGIDLTFLFV